MARGECRPRVSHGLVVDVRKWIPSCQTRGGGGGGATLVGVSYRCGCVTRTENSTRAVEQVFRRWAANGTAARRQVPPPGWGSNTSRPVPAGSRLAASIMTGKREAARKNIYDVVLGPDPSSPNDRCYRLFLFDGDIFYHVLQTGSSFFFFLLPFQAS